MYMCMYMYMYMYICIHERTSVNGLSCIKCTWLQNIKLFWLRIIYLLSVSLKCCKLKLIDH